MLKTFPTVDYAVFRQTRPGFHIKTRTILNHELVFFTKGKGVVHLEGKPHTVGAGDLTYFRPGVPHSLRTVDSDPCEFYGVHFTLNEPDRTALPLESFSRWDSFPKQAVYLSELTRFWNRKDYLDDWEADLMLSRVLLELSRGTEATSSPACRMRLMRAVSCLHQNTDRVVDIKELCALTGMKKSYLIREFQKLTGLTPIQYALSLRLEHGKMLLLNEDCPIREVAARCGFKDEFYFSRIFRQRFSKSPSAFRKEG